MGKLKNLYYRYKDSLKFKLIYFYMMVLVIFISGFEIFSYFSLKEYYLNNVKSNMVAQSKYSQDLYESTISEYTLSEVVLNERFEFLNNIQGQVQILDNTGVIYYDNTGNSKIGIPIDDYTNLLTENGQYKFVLNENEKTMSLNYPITSKGTQIGILKTTTSLDIIIKQIYGRMNLFLIFGIFSILTGFILIYHFSNRFLRPINKLTTLANKLSDGRYKEKSNMEYKGEIGELARTMDELSNNILKKEEIKTDFISSVSHELRTPLTSIKGWAITLQDDDIDEETINDGLKIIEKESDRLSDMVEDLLDFSRFTSPRFTLTKSQFNIIPVVKNIINQLKPRSTEKNINMIFDYDENEIRVVADENRLKQVFINIIDNAIKFTLDSGTIITSIKRDKENNNLICEVVDTGIGISEEEVELVTTKFYKGSSSESHTGLGLSICEEIILQHNGKLEIFSKLGVGTTIHFEIPILGEI